MPLTREERFEATMHDLRRVLYGATRYDAKDEQGGVVVDLTPALTLHVECFAQLNRWRGRLLSEDVLLEEWLTKDRPVWNVIPHARVGLYRAFAFALQAHFLVEDRVDVLARLYPGEPTGAAELRLAQLMESLVSRWVGLAGESKTLLPLDELAAMQVYFAAAPGHPSFDRFGSVQADTLDNSDNEFSSAWDECYAIARRLALELGASVPPSPPWPTTFG